MTNTTAERISIFNSVDLGNNFEKTWIPGCQTQRKGRVAEKRSCSLDPVSTGKQARLWAAQSRLYQRPLSREQNVFFALREIHILSLKAPVPNCASPEQWRSARSSSLSSASPRSSPRRAAAARIDRHKYATHMLQVAAWRNVALFMSGF